MSITRIKDLPSILVGSGTYPEADEMIKLVLGSANKAIYTRDEEFRLAAYAAMIDWACHAILDDGGPAAALWFLEHAMHWMRREAEDRARNWVGPFMSDMLRKEIVEDSEDA